jgi:hypothetical protein
MHMILADSDGGIEAILFVFSGLAVSALATSSLAIFVLWFKRRETK